MNTRQFVHLKPKGKKTAVVVNISQIVSIDLRWPLRLQLVNGQELEVDPEDANDFVKALQERTMYADGTPCSKPFGIE